MSVGVCLITAVKNMVSERQKQIEALNDISNSIDATIDECQSARQNKEVEIAVLNQAISFLDDHIEAAKLSLAEVAHKFNNIVKDTEGDQFSSHSKFIKLGRQFQSLISAHELRLKKVEALHHLAIEAHDSWKLRYEETLPSYFATYV
ncbi:unnamed protein product [Protopolystoma xenopodis]|uniref:Uncharacterized protein n=1 Tax=Protopolystoma xenopodis TaxID=117903 RepID=A0A448WIL0_9PLAT|nr:unnamed protein product [Protopolystoma xenopodis]